MWPLLPSYGAPGSLMWPFSFGDTVDAEKEREREIDRERKRAV